VLYELKVDLKSLFLKRHIITDIQAILQPGHLKHSINTLLAVAFPLPLMLGITLFSGARFFRAIKKHPYLSLMALPLAGAFFTLNSTIPRPLDWDVFALLAFPLVLIAGLWVAEIYPPEKAPALASGIVLTALAFTIPWIWSNHAIIRIWPDALAQERDRPYLYLDLLELLSQAEISVPEKPLCDNPSTDPTHCRYVAVTEFGFHTPVGFYTRPVIFAHPPASISFNVELPPEPCFLWIAPALDPWAMNWPGDGVTFEVKVIDERGKEHLIFNKFIPKEEGKLGWHHSLVDLTLYKGLRIKLVFQTNPGPNGDFTGDRAGWGVLWIVKGMAEGFYHELW